MKHISTSTSGHKQFGFDKDLRVYYKISFGSDWTDWNLMPLSLNSKEFEDIILLSFSKLDKYIAYRHDNHCSHVIALEWLDKHIDYKPFIIKTTIPGIIIWTNGERYWTNKLYKGIGFDNFSEALLFAVDSEYNRLMTYYIHGHGDCYKQLAENIKKSYNKKCNQTMKFSSILNKDNYAVLKRSEFLMNSAKI